MLCRAISLCSGVGPSALISAAAPHIHTPHSRFRARASSLKETMFRTLLLLPRHSAARRAVVEMAPHQTAATAAMLSSSRGTMQFGTFNGIDSHPSGGSCTIKPPLTPPPQHRMDRHSRGKAVRVDIRLTPRVESAWFRLLESTARSSHWFQPSTCTPTAR